ncbi:MAG TPA: hypothetical protein VFI16_05455, partial [Anaeromyxobacteraceae bacterium]|nr:hypothetical protein [Anaeromyxobacteraceae bacterium]
MPDSARATCGIDCIYGCTTPTVALSVIPASPTEGSAAAVSCSASGGTTTALTVSVGGGTLPGGSQSEYVVGSSAFLQWNTPAAGAWPVGCATTGGRCTNDASTSRTVVVAAAAPPPVIDSLSGPASPVVAGQSYTFTAAAHDPQGLSFTYQWSASHGTITGAGDTALWTAPGAPGGEVVTVQVLNSGGGIAAQDYPVDVASAVYQGQVPANVPKPRRLASAPGGRVFAVDGYGSLWLVTPAGETLGMVSLAERATSVAASATEVFVGTEQGSVLVLDPQRAVVKRRMALGFSAGPNGMAFEPSRGVLWMAMRGAGQLMAIRLDGSFAAAVPLMGVADVTLDAAHGLVWAMRETSDPAVGGGVVSAYTLDGAWVRTIVPVGGGPGQVYRANGVATDAAGRVYVSDPLAGQVVVVTSTGAPYDALGFSGPGRLTRPAGLTFLGNGDILVADTDQGHLERFGTGAPLPACQVGGRPDSDCDGLPDWWETANGLNPNWAGDALLDLDGDGLTDLQEFALGTNPRNADTDGDGLTDGEEVLAGLNPLDPGDNRPVMVASSPPPSGPGLVRLGATVTSQTACGASWKQTAGPAVLLRGADTLSPSFVARAPGTYAFQGKAICGRAV